jgi:hypothetical protein
MVDSPPKASTTTVSVPAPLAGTVTVSFVGLVTLVTEAGVPPTVTDVTVVKPVPMRVTLVLCVAGPSLGETEPTVGGATSGPDEMVKVMVSLYVPLKAVAGTSSHQSVARLTPPIPVVTPALAKMLGAGVPPRDVPVSVTG